MRKSLSYLLLAASLTAATACGAEPATADDDPQPISDDEGLALYYGQIGGDDYAHWMRNTALQMVERQVADGAPAARAQEIGLTAQDVRAIHEQAFAPYMDRINASFIRQFNAILQPGDGAELARTATDEQIVAVNECVAEQATSGQEVDWNACNADVGAADFEQYLAAQERYGAAAMSVYSSEETLTYMGLLCRALDEIGQRMSTDERQYELTIRNFGFANSPRKDCAVLMEELDALDARAAQ